MLALFSGLYGRHRLCQVYDANEQGSGVLPSPCFSNFLARTTFILESLPEAKNPGQDAFWGILSLTVVILDIKAYLVIDCDCW